MRGVCGWLGAWYDDAAASRHLSGMLHGPSAGLSSSCVFVSRAAAIAASGFAGGYDTFREGELLVAIEGRPTGAIASARSIARRYLEKGEQVVSEVGGSFTLAILDPVHRSAILAIDRLGIRPMVFAPVKDGLLFGGDIDAIRRHPMSAGRIDPQAVFEYLYFHVVPSPRTIFAGMQKLPPGHLVRYENGALRLARYWQPAFADSMRGVTEPALASELRETLRAAIRTADRDGAAGTFLSGGIDSSTVAGLKSEIGNGRVRTYSIGFDAAGFDEIAYARIAAQRFNLDSREYYVTPDDVAQTIDTVARAYDEPFGNSSALPAYHCARLAREDGYATLLAGDGGDELFAGNARYAKQGVFEHYAGVPAWLRHRVVEPMALGMPEPLAVPPVRKLRSYIRQALVPLPERLETYNLLHMRPLDEIFERAFLESVDVESPVRALTEQWASVRSDSTLNRMLCLDWKFTLADNDLRKVNRMAELNGVEVRYPMLDDALVEFSTRVPPTLKLRGTSLRYFYKRAMRGFLPDAILDKSKHGFGLPFGNWMRTDPALSAMAEESLRALQRRGIVRSEFIDRVLEEHSTSHAGFFGEMVWVLMMLERWWQAHEAPAEAASGNQASAEAGRR
jgi:asparagine synthase (glutamine-hydrolysing)